MDASASRFPQRVGWYELLTPIGAGGMATVYLGLAAAEDGSDKRVAVKLINAFDDEQQVGEGVMREAKVAARIRHPNVVPMLDVGQDAFGFYLVMEYVDGDTLAGLTRLARKKNVTLPAPVKLRILSDALLGLSAAHELRDNSGRCLGLMHRDFSPQNILVGRDGITRLTDFGIAKSAFTRGATRTGHVKGKVGYMSPEQVRNGELDQRTDVWAAGVVAWELFAGQRLYSGKDELQTMLQIVQEEPKALSEVLPDVPKSIDKAIKSALETSVDNRCPSAEHFRRKLIEGQEPADPEQVARLVRGLVAEKLAERERHIIEIKELRGRLGELTAPTLSGTTTTDEGLPVQEPSSKTETEVTAVEEEPEDETDSTTLLLKEEVSSEASTVSVTAPTHPPKRNLPQPLVGVLATVMSVVVVFLGAMLFVLNRNASGTNQPARLGRAPAIRFPVPKPKPSALPQPEKVSEDVGELVIVRSNVSLKRLVVGGETIPLPAPADRIEIQAPTKATPIVATAVDGRQLRGTAQAGHEVDLHFPAKRRWVPRPSAKSTPTKGEKSTKTSPFAGNPYKPKDRE